MKSTPVAWPWSPLLLVVEIAILLSLPFLYCLTAHQAISTDPYVYGQTAKEMLAGHKLYLDAWQDKPPLVFLFFAIPQLFVPHSYAALSFFLGVCLAIQALMFRWVFRSNRLSAFCCLLFVALFPMTNPDFVWLSSEHLSNFFIAGNLLLAFAIYRDRRFSLQQCAAIGALTCAAFHVRQNALFTAAMPLLAIVMAERPAQAKMTGIAIMTAAALVCWGLILAWMASSGDLHGYFYTVFVYPRLYASAGESSSELSLLSDFFEQVLPLLLAISLGLCWGKRYQWLALAGVVVGMGFCMLPQRAYPHYWANLLPFVALLMGLAMQDPREGARRVFVSMAAWLFVFCAFLTLMRIRAAYENPSNADYERIAEATDRAAPPGSTLLVCGEMPCMGIQFASTLPAANTYSALFQLRPPWVNSLMRPLNTIYDDYLAKPPTVMDIQKDWLPGILDHTEAPDMPNDAKLVRLLMYKYTYRPVGEVNGFVICLRQ